MKSLVFIFITLFITPQIYAIGYYEIGLNGSISKYKNSEISYTKTNTAGASFAYRFISASALEISYTNTFQMVVGPYSSTRGIIDVASLNLLIYVLGNRCNLQPFIKGGAGYMKRQYKYMTEGYETIDTREESMSVTFGAGLKYMITGNLAIQGAATGYITDFKEESYFVHYTITAGISFIF